MKQRPILLAMLSLLASTAARAVCGQAPVDTSAQHPIAHRSAYEDMQMFSQVLNQIRVNHPDSIDVHELIMAAVRGMVSAADPHSYVVQRVHLTPEKEKDWLDGKSYPVPLQFSFIEGTPVVVGVLPGSNAARSGILVGDVLLAADSVPIFAESSMELDVYLSGKKNSSVVLRFERERTDGSTVEFERVVKRELLGERETAVPAVFMLDSTTGYIRISTFVASNVSDDLHAGVTKLESQGMRRLILDLRDNGGGRVDEAAKVAGQFLPTGALVWTAKGRKASVTDTGRVKRSLFSASERRYPMVVMINAGTASASELVAGALQDHDRAVIVGQPSFGKSLIMYGFPLMDGEGSYIEMVVGHMSTPCGRVIQRQYHAYTQREYYRMARADRDTAGRPWCKTDNGRVVYGGGGIYPDLRFPRRAPRPVWLERASETDVIFKFITAYMAANQSSLPTLIDLASNPRLPAAAIEQFRAFAAKDSVELQSGTEADSLLQRVLVQALAWEKWGPEGGYRMYAVLDPDVKRAVEAFDRAQQILGPQH